MSRRGWRYAQSGTVDPSGRLGPSSRPLQAQGAGGVSAWDAVQLAPWCGGRHDGAEGAVCTRQDPCLYRALSEAIVCVWAAGLRACGQSGGRDGAGIPCGGEDRISEDGAEDGGLAFQPFVRCESLEGAWSERDRERFRGQGGALRATGRRLGRPSLLPVLVKAPVIASL